MTPVFPHLPDVSDEDKNVSPLNLPVIRTANTLKKLHFDMSLNKDLEQDEILSNVHRYVEMSWLDTLALSFPL